MIRREAELALESINEWLANDEGLVIEKVITWRSRLAAALHAPDCATRNTGTSWREPCTCRGDYTEGNWAIVALMGNQLTAGFVSIVRYGQHALVEVAEPTASGNPQIKSYGFGAIYSIENVEEKQVRAMLGLPTAPPTKDANARRYIDGD